MIDIFFIVSMVNRMTDWMVRNGNISRQPNADLKTYKTLLKPHVEYYTQAWAPASKHGY